MSNSKGPFFVRFTYEECRSVGTTGGGYEALGIQQDIRMMDGFFELSDDHGALQYNIVAGKLHRIEKEFKARDMKLQTQPKGK